MTPALLEQYFSGFARRLADKPNAAHLDELALASYAVPEPLLSDLAAKMSALDPDAVASILAVRAREIATDGLRYDDATDFVRALVSELQRYIDAPPEAMAEALAELKRHERDGMH